MGEELEGFGIADASDFTEDGSSKANVKTKKDEKKGSKKKSGGFQTMGLSFPVLKGIQKRGYKIPTPIQRKTIPVVLSGHDVVAMARTGSGKTACFLIPLFEKLLSSVRRPGARGLILSPTRELALQTLKFINEIGKFANLKPAVILGGDSMDNQFAALHGNPDIIVATPGRLLHVCVEMDLKLHCVQYVVFDEADRLFEMGFGEQLMELLKRLPESRQTLLFSATLPKVLVEFAKAGLNEPALIRLDVESKIPEKLELAFLCCRSEDKVAALLYLLKCIIPSKSQSVVFAATKHHVEFLKMILDKADISNSCIYSTLDPSARKINAAKFQLNKVSVLLVTDIAARGLDIPQLDNVINFHFPAKSKLFVHRVGRCARAGRQGNAYSLVSYEEFPYLLDLYLFLGRPLQVGEENSSLGSVPPHILEEEQNDILKWLKSSVELTSLCIGQRNAYKAYLRSRPGASVDSVKRVKELGLSYLKPHPVFQKLTPGTQDENDKSVLINRIREYKPKGTIFEIGTQSTSSMSTIMKAAKAKHKEKILNFKRKKEEKEKVNPMETEFQSYLPNAAANQADPMPTEDFDVPPSKKKKKKNVIDSAHFIPYQPSDHHTEQGLSVNSFHSEASKITFDLTADSEEGMAVKKKQMRWDRKKKKFVGVNQDSKVGKIRTESGVWIPATYKTDKYAQWKERNKIDVNEESDEESDSALPDTKKAFVGKKFPNTHWGRHNRKVQQKIKSDLKRPEQILNERLRKEKKENRLKRKQKRRKGKR